MRVLQITYSYKPLRGGADWYAEDLRRVLAAQGWEVGVLQKPPRPADDPAVYTYPAALAGRNAFWLLPWSLLLMPRALARWDVLICHYPNYCLPACWHRRVIGLSHGVTWDDVPRAWRGRLKKAWARWAWRHCARFVANDTFFLRELGLPIAPGHEPYVEVAPGRWYVPNAVDPQVFAPGPPGAEAARLRPFVLVPRNLYWNRGVHLGIQAFAQLAGRWPELRLVVVGGEGQRHAVEAARQAVEEHGLQERVLFVGARRREELVGWYRAAEVTLIPSLCGEGTSLAALESMACGTPVVATDVAGLADLPCLHAAAAPGPLAQALAHALRERSAEAQRQREIVCAQFNLPRWAAAWTYIVTQWDEKG
jgi:glycosyltransferase involved in cell wall biosynthesis